MVSQVLSIIAKKIKISSSKIYHWGKKQMLKLKNYRNHSNVINSPVFIGPVIWMNSDFSDTMRIALAISRTGTSDNMIEKVRRLHIIHNAMPCSDNVSFGYNRSTAKMLTCVTKRRLVWEIFNFRSFSIDDAWIASTNVGYSHKKKTVD